MVFFLNKEDFMLVDGGFNEEMDGDAESIDGVSNNDWVLLIHSTMHEEDWVVTKRGREGNERIKAKLVKERMSRLIITMRKSNKMYLALVLVMSLI